MKLTHGYTDSKSWKYFWGILFKLIAIITIVLAISLLVLDINSKREILISLLAVLGFTSMTHFLPLLVLFVNHWRFGKNMEIVFDTEALEYSIINPNGHKIKLHETDIENIIKVVSPPSYDDRVDWLFFGKYFYWILDTKENGQLKISCLTCDLDQLFNPLKIKKEKRMFPLV